MNNSSNKLYIEILTWAFDRQEGFTEEELNEKFELRKTPQRWSWYQMIFIEGRPENPALFKHFGENKNKRLWSLSSRGMSAAVDYVELKEARESSMKAVRLARYSFLLAAAVGTAQILIMLCNT